MEKIFEFKLVLESVGHFWKIPRSMIVSDYISISVRRDKIAKSSLRNTERQKERTTYSLYRRKNETCNGGSSRFHKKTLQHINPPKKVMWN